MRSNNRSTDGVFASEVGIRYDNSDITYKKLRNRCALYGTGCTYINSHAVGLDSIASFKIPTALRSQNQDFLLRI